MQECALRLLKKSAAPKNTSGRGWAVPLNERFSCVSPRRLCRRWPAQTQRSRVCHQSENAPLQKERVLLVSKQHARGIRVPGLRPARGSCCGKNAAERKAGFEACRPTWEGPRNQFRLPPKSRSIIRKRLMKSRYKVSAPMIAPRRTAVPSSKGAASPKRRNFWVS